MRKLFYKGNWYTAKELADKSGIPAHTVRDRLRRGFSVEESVKPIATHDSIKEFGESSWYEDWIGMSVNDLHKIYWKWCIQHGYTPITKQGFSRQLLSMYPNLKTIPTRRGDKCYRVIRKKVF